MDIDIRFYDPAAVTVHSHNRVPHWNQQGATYFLTFRLADSVPADAMSSYRSEKERWLAANGQPPWSPELEKEYHRRFTGRFEGWLDKGYGSCLLRERENAALVAETMMHFEGERSRLHAWVIMPNHVHALVSLVGNEELSALLKSWKGFTARHINLRCAKSGSLWQRSYFDRIVRDWDHFASCARYIRNNPAKAKLDDGSFLRGESDFVRKMLA